MKNIKKQCKIILFIKRKIEIRLSKIRNWTILNHFNKLAKTK